MRIRVNYPSGAELIIVGDWVGPRRISEEGVIIVALTEDCTMPAGSLPAFCEAGSHLYGDPRGVFRDIDKGDAILYRPQLNDGGLPDWAKDWMRENPEWPTKSLDLDPGTTTAYLIDHPRAEALQRQILEHPIYQQYMVISRQTASSMTNAFEQRPWLAIGEKLFMAGELLHVYEDGQDIKTDLRIDLAEALINAPTFMWQWGPYHIALEMPIPRHTFTTASAIYPTMFWSFLSDSTGNSEWPYVRGTLLMQDNEALVLWAHLYRDGSSTPKLIANILENGAIYPDTFAEEQIPQVAGTIQLLAFLNSPYLGVVESRPDRAMRRRMERMANVHDPRPIDDKVNVVMLRSVLPNETTPGDESEFVTKEWHHRWWVRGHMRAQWYPSLKGHKLIWVAPHLKGPDGLPLLKKAYNVAR